MRGPGKGRGVPRPGEGTVATAACRMREELRAKNPSHPAASGGIPVRAIHESPRGSQGIDPLSE